MIEKFQSIIYALTRPKEGGAIPPIFDPTEQFDEKSTDNAAIARKLNAAFLIGLAGPNHPAAQQAKGLLTRMVESPLWADVASFYLSGIERMHWEIETTCKDKPDFANQINTLSKWLSRGKASFAGKKTAENTWSVFFPEGISTLTSRKDRLEGLRKKRAVTITHLNDNPVTDPVRQILFASNVLLTIPAKSKSPEDLSFRHDLKEKLIQISKESQLYWYDHPIQVGVDPEKSEIVYGLRGLDSMLEFERQRGNASDDAKLTCVLSVSVTHPGLKEIARDLIKEDFLNAGGLKNVEVYVFTEADTQRLIDEILAPVGDLYLGRKDAAELLTVFGVDGEYGRHYSFLKAISAFWHILVEPEVKATFKIDLDQIFPQKELVEQTSSSALEHLTTALWGAHGLDSDGRPVELGLIAGALVNKSDIGKSLFTPDVTFPNRDPSPDEYIFFSMLPQALSTEAEMMTRYDTDELDGKRKCIQRIHVTGGTSGVLVDCLRRHRPFTPSFMGRAEDQAYILSLYPNPGIRLAYLHKDGLIMRHDKVALTQDAIQSAHVGKLIGDYVRILYFSAYAKVLADNIDDLKDYIDPFTGCFVSKIPITVVYLRFALKAASFFVAGQEEQGVEFITDGVKRIAKALEFVRGDNSMLKKCYEKERLGWDLYYDILAAFENALLREDDFALELREKARKIIELCSISFAVH
jgi:hypothetical protein